MWMESWTKTCGNTYFCTFSKIFQNFLSKRVDFPISGCSYRLKGNPHALHLENFTVWPGTFPVGERLSVYLANRTRALLCWRHQHNAATLQRDNDTSVIRGPAMMKAGRLKLPMARPLRAPGKKNLLIILLQFLLVSRVIPINHAWINQQNLPILGKERSREKW